MSQSGAPAAGDRPVYSISAVARMLDIPVATLRTWEDRYAQVAPARNGSGHRLFTRRQVEQLRLVRAQMTGGATAADAHRLLAERILVVTGPARSCRRRKEAVRRGGPGDVVAAGAVRLVDHHLP